MNKKDMQKHRFNHLDIVNLTSFYNGKERYANNFKVIEYDIAPGCVATYFPEANVLVPIESVAEKSNTPVSKFVALNRKRVLSKDVDVKIQVQNLPEF